ncbi:MAG: nascent polypeptide-associated complex protein [Thermoplasmata archaeon]|nr:MAG: nascent polypeptide-associated complex protein [Thermoplasmata archaeon]
MIPGGRGLSQKHMKAMMKRHGLNIEEMEGVTEVIIKTADRTLIFKDAAVTCMEVQGQRTYQVVGTPQEVASETGIPKEDIKLVAEQAGVTEAEARKALEACDGEPAEAIIKLMGEKS